MMVSIVSAILVETHALFLALANQSVNRNANRGLLGAKGAIIGSLWIKFGADCAENTRMNMYENITPKIETTAQGVDRKLSAVAEI